MDIWEAIVKRLLYSCGNFNHWLIVFLWKLEFAFAEQKTASSGHEQNTNQLQCLRLGQSRSCSRAAQWRQ